MRLTIIPADKYIAVDGKGLLNIQQDLSWIPSDIHAVQWYDTWGEIEYIDDRPNLKIEEIGIFHQAIQIHIDEIKRIEDEQESSRDYWVEFRQIRDTKLLQSDWTQVVDSPLTDEQKVAWQSYRQALRDLPEIITDPKPLVLDKNHPSWPVKP